MIIIYIFLLVISVFTINSYLSLRKLRENSNSSNLNDERYFELKYKLQYISSVGIVIIGVCGFFGYDKMEKFVDKFESKTDSLNIKIKAYDNKLLVMDSTIQSYDTKISTYNSFIRKINLSKNKISKDILSSNNLLASLTDTIDIIRKRNILDKSFYVIDNLNLENGATKPKRFYFKDMTTIIGDNLPIFDKKPVIFIIPTSGANMLVTNLTTEYVEIAYGMYDSYDTDPKTFQFGILIAKRLR